MLSRKASSEKPVREPLLERWHAGDFSKARQTTLTPSETSDPWAVLELHCNDRKLSGGIFTTEELALKIF